MDQQPKPPAFLCTKEEFEALYKSCRPKWEGMARDMGYGRHEKEEYIKDAFQEAILKLYWDCVQGKLYPGAALCTIAISYAINILKELTRKKKDDSQVHGEVEDPDEPDNEMLDRIMQALDRLDAMCRELLERFYLRQESYEFIALQMNLSTAAVRQRKHRCMKALEDLLR